MALKNFFAELKRRNVYKVAVAYAVVAWLLIQVATQVFPFFEIPNWGIRLVVLLIAIGFPIAIVIAWAFELTPEGLKRTEWADGEPVSPTRNKAWIYFVIIGLRFRSDCFSLAATPLQANNANRLTRACNRPVPFPKNRLQCYRLKMRAAMPRRNISRTASPRP